MDCHSRLESLYQTWQSLRPTSSDKQFDVFGAFFDEACIAWLKSMREWDQPSIGRQAIIDKVKANTELHHLEERRVLSSFTSEDGLKVVCEMKNRLSVIGNPLDPFYETAVATFNEQGLITDFKLYNCRSPIVGIIQTMTGRGPYTLDAAKQEFEHAERHSNSQVADTGLAPTPVSVEYQCCQQVEDTEILKE
ncbi:hypothetical protein MMC17_005693 [Xylographa soralifera]|nr:hypothetical protein [Xylographa soralifera]